MFYFINQFPDLKLNSNILNFQLYCKFNNNLQISQLLKASLTVFLFAILVLKF